MKALMRQYIPGEDFIRIRDFLKKAYYSFGQPTNWGLERWNWSRYHPCMFDGDPAAIQGYIKHFEQSIRIWEANGHIVAVLNTEWRTPNGEAWIQRVPEADPLLDEILAEAESFMADPSDGRLQLDMYDHDTELAAAALKRGYVRPDYTEYWSEIDLSAERPVLLPPGFAISSMAAADSSLAERCKVQGLGFDHPDPADWATPEQYRQVQCAPDYRADQDLFVVAPDGQYASCCIVWYDELNRFGVFEPFCTDPAFRKLGLGKALIMAGLNLLYRKGACRAYVGSDQQFYVAAGFKLAWPGRKWIMQL
jgi:GNAT superfamily N-acetyltransferase